MLRDVVGNILGVEPDLSIVADGVDAGAMVEWVERERPDVVMLWAHGGSPRAMSEELLGRFPRLAVVALEERGQRGSIYVMRPMRTRMAEISRAHLVTAIRRAAHDAAGPGDRPRRRRVRGGRDGTGDESAESTSEYGAGAVQPEQGGSAS